MDEELNKLFEEAKALNKLGKDDDFIRIKLSEEGLCIQEIEMILKRINQIGNGERRKGGLKLILVGFILTLFIIPAYFFMFGIEGLAFLFFSLFFLGGLIIIGGIFKLI